MTEFFDGLNAAILAAAEQPWFIVLTLLLIVADGIFPAVPSEALVMALAAIDGPPTLALLIPVAAAGAIAGDNLAFTVGRLIGPGRFRRWELRRMAAALDAGRRQLERRPATVILTGRFVPVGRVAVYIAAGLRVCPPPLPAGEHRRRRRVGVLHGRSRPAGRCLGRRQPAAGSGRGSAAVADDRGRRGPAHPVAQATPGGAVDGLGGRTQMTPWASIASATWTKASALAPRT